MKNLTKISRLEGKQMNKYKEDKEGEFNKWIKWMI